MALSAYQLVVGEVLQIYLPENVFLVLSFLRFPNLDAVVANIRKLCERRIDSIDARQGTCDATMALRQILNAVWHYMPSRFDFGVLNARPGGDPVPENFQINLWPSQVPMEVCPEASLRELLCLSVPRRSSRRPCHQPAADYFEVLKEFLDLVRDYFKEEQPDRRRKPIQRAQSAVKKLKLVV